MSKTQKDAAGMAILIIFGACVLVALATLAMSGTSI